MNYAKFLSAILLTGVCAAADAERPSQARLVADVASVQPGTPFRMGVLITLDDHWHTYWQNPGDAGMAPEMEWHLPDGFTAGPILWPAPRRFEEPPLFTFGYDHEVLLFREIRPPASLAVGRSCTLGVKVSWLVCNQLCMPQTAQLDLVLPIRAGAPASADKNAAFFARATQELPVSDPTWHFHVLADRASLSLCVAPPPDLAPDAMMRAIFFPAQPNLVAYAATSWTHAAQEFVLQLQRLSPDGPLPARLLGVLVLPQAARTGAKAVEVNVVLPAMAGPPRE